MAVARLRRKKAFAIARRESRITAGLGNFSGCRSVRQIGNRPHWLKLLAPRGIRHTCAGIIKLRLASCLECHGSMLDFQARSKGAGKCSAIVHNELGSAPVT